MVEMQKGKRFRTCLRKCNLGSLFPVKFSNGAKMPQKRHFSIQICCIAIASNSRNAGI